MFRYQANNNIRPFLALAHCLTKPNVYVLIQYTYVGDYQELMK
jgi:hypothetical protein